ncbi:hypothetical protein IMY05_C4383001100 [Salix suchowensis]|nr:hypothetical protein IMY05_C4383001100 [Salix suchowensis]
MYHTRAHCRVEANGSEGNFENDRIQPQSIRSGNGISGQATLSDGANGLVNTRAQVSRKDEARKTEEPRAGEVNDEIQITVHLDDKFLPNISGRTAHAQWPFPKDLSNPHIPEGGTHNIVFSSDSSEFAASTRPLLCNPELDTIIQLLDESLHNHPRTPAAISTHGGLPTSPALAGPSLNTADALGGIISQQCAKERRAPVPTTQEATLPCAHCFPTKMDLLELLLYPISR